MEFSNVHHEIADNNLEPVIVATIRVRFSELEDLPFYGKAMYAEIYGHNLIEFLCEQMSPKPILEIQNDCSD